jgi:hypothetical protein
LRNQVFKYVSAFAYYLAKLVLSKLALGLFLIYAACFYTYVFQFSWIFVVIAVVGTALCLQYLSNNADVLLKHLSFLYKNGAMAIGLILAVGACLLYFAFGFNIGVFAAWLLSIAICGRIFFERRTFVMPKPKRSDLVVLISLFLVSLPLYLWSVYTVPFQMNSDESVILTVEQEYARKGIFDLFGVSDYFGLMYCPFLVQGRIAEILGGIDLFHVRMVGALTGVLIVLCAYVFYRALSMRLPVALMATIFLGCNHSLVGISRMVSQSNGGLLMELLASTALFEGVKRKCPWLSYLGGVLTGCCFYIYYAARMTLPIWLAFVALLLIFNFKQNSYPIKKLVYLLLVFFLGFAISIAPIIPAHLRAPRAAEQAAFAYQKQMCLLFPEGRLAQVNRWRESSIASNVAHSLVNGLTSFNNNVIDQAFIYPNAGHGFVDPISGLLLWFGVIRVVVFFGFELSALFMLSAFFVEFFIYSFIVAPAPDYPRLLVMLPFAGYFVAYGIEGFVLAFDRLFGTVRRASSGQLRVAVFACIASSIVILNLSILNDFVRAGLSSGNDIGGTARYLEARKNQTNHLYIVVSGDDYPYFEGGGVVSPYSNVLCFIAPSQDCKFFASGDLTTVKVVPPFSIFMTENLWRLKEKELTRMYPHLIVHKISRDRGRVAIEDPTDLPSSGAIHLAYKEWNEYPQQLEVALSQGKYQEAESLALRFLHSPEPSINGSYFKSRILLALGIAYVHENKFAEAEAPLLEAMNIRVQTAGANASETAEVAQALGELYLAWHQPSKSEEWFQKAAKITEAVRQRP